MKLMISESDYTTMDLSRLADKINSVNSYESPIDISAGIWFNDPSKLHIVISENYSNFHNSKDATLYMQGNDYVLRSDYPQNTVVFKSEREIVEYFRKFVNSQVLPNW